MLMLDDVRHPVPEAPGLRVRAAVRAALGLIGDLIVPPCSLACREPSRAVRGLLAPGAVHTAAAAVRHHWPRLLTIPASAWYPPWRSPILLPTTGPMRWPLQRQHAQAGAPLQVRRSPRCPPAVRPVAG